MVCNVLFCAVAALTIAVAWFQRVSFRIKTTSFIVAYTVWLLIVMVLSGRECHMDRGYFFCLCWLLFFPLQSVFVNQTVRKNVVWLFVVCVAFEMMVGFAQLFGLLGSGNSFFVLGGSFGNPALFAAYISLVMPFLLAEYLCVRKCSNNEIKRYVILLCLIFMAYFLAISYSRGAWMSVLASSLYIIENNIHILEKIKKILSARRKIILASVTCTILVAGMVVALYSIKKDSADGRLFIWKVSASQNHQNVLLGNGIGTFEAKYGEWQRDYFANNGGTERERYLADYVTCAYNEFLEAYVEQGVIGLLLLIMVLIAALRFKPCGESSVFVPAKSAVIGFVILCFVSYPTHCEVLYLQFVVTLALLYSHQERKEKHNILGSLVQPLLFVGIVFGGLVPLWQGFSRCNAGRQKVMRGDVEGALSLYESAYPQIYNNGTFLFYYGSALAISGDIHKSIEVLEQAEQKSSDNHIPLLLGDGYKAAGDTVKALAAYQRAIDGIPSLLYPQYKKAKLYFEMGDRDNACRLAHKIISAKEKVSTTAAKEIKEEMRNMLNKEKIDLK